MAAVSLRTVRRHKPVTKHDCWQQLRYTLENNFAYYLVEACEQLGYLAKEEIDEFYASLGSVAVFDAWKQQLCLFVMCAENLDSEF